ncbi:MAG: Phosphoribosylformylglycinamidine cyclo-ligase [Syntrophorhabdus sp. PtaU1.Bin002]|nr:MAG: Phosphoribosylformylglycinamidine cyclo-ligase [Syntrophorhabdus sp. PtaB.Bin006]OPY72137.1 MAG: Phosphoribosylformylglycinamidine cyclo-ligase [Syntrophorhabdus sp. PtaU1.Bin002]
MAVTTYKDAGVDIKKADDVLNRIKHKITSTFNPHVLTSIGGFGALSEVPKQYKDPILVSSTDGVGTKLKIAFNANKHDTVGIDLVGMSVNDILTSGAKPFFFLDYFATGHIEEQVYESVITGICEGCRMAECALIGGETAEMPSFYREGEYDLAGFAMGFVERDKIVNGSTIQEGDIVIGLASNGLHSNGFSLVRKVLFEVHNLKVYDRVEGLSEPLFEALLRPTRIYVKPVVRILDRFVVKGMAHITGGGLPGNISRIIPEGFGVSLNVSLNRVPEIFKLIQKFGNITRDEMCSTFNMGIGYVLVVNARDEQAILSQLEQSGEVAFRFGIIERVSGRETVQVVFNP